MNNFIINAFLIFLLLIASNLRAENIIKIVETKEAILGDLTSSIRLTGVIKSAKNVTILAQSDGIIDKIYVSSGSIVKKNEIIATLVNYKSFTESEKIL